MKGAPTYAKCTRKGKATDASSAAVSSKVLQLLRASTHGKFRTRGRYSAATVLGTIFFSAFDDHSATHATHALAITAWCCLIPVAAAIALIFRLPMHAREETTA